MKSAYDLAMERFSEPDGEGSEPLSLEQKEALGEVDRVYAAKIAEKEIFLQKKLIEARHAGEREALEQIQTQLRYERSRLEDEKEAAKNRIRTGAA